MYFCKLKYRSHHSSCLASQCINSWIFVFSVVAIIRPKSGICTAANHCSLFSNGSQLRKVTKNTEYVIDLGKIQKARKLFGKELSAETMASISASIVKKNCRLEELEKFLRANIEKKFLIPIFMHNL